MCKAALLEHELVNKANDVKLEFPCEQLIKGKDEEKPL